MKMVRHIENINFNPYFKAGTFLSLVKNFINSMRHCINLGIHLLKNKVVDITGLYMVKYFFKIRLFAYIIYIGLAHGPFWILPSFGQNQYMYVHFNRGYLVPENAIFLDSKAKYAMMGTLNGTFLEEAELVDLEKVAEYQCMPVIKIPLRDPQITPQRCVFNKFCPIKIH